MYVEWRRMERRGLAQVQRMVRQEIEETTWLRCYSSWLVPGLAQTRDYTVSVLRAVRERRQVAVDDVESAADERMKRQEILHEGHRRFAFLMEESVLHNCLGGPSVLAGQLSHLMTLGSLPNVSLGVVPASSTRSRMPVEGFWLHDNGDHREVTVELVSGYLTITQPSEVALYEQTFRQMTGMAEYGAAARSRIGAALEALS